MEKPCTHPTHPNSTQQFWAKFARNLCDIYGRKSKEHSEVIADSMRLCEKLRHHNPKLLPRSERLLADVEKECPTAHGTLLGNYCKHLSYTPRLATGSAAVAHTIVRGGLLAMYRSKSYPKALIKYAEAEAEHEASKAFLSEVTEAESRGVFILFTIAYYDDSRTLPLLRDFWQVWSMCPNPAAKFFTRSVTESMSTWIKRQGKRPEPTRAIGCVQDSTTVYRGLNEVTKDRVDSCRDSLVRAINALKQGDFR